MLEAPLRRRIALLAALAAIAAAVLLLWAARREMGATDANATLAGGSAERAEEEFPPAEREDGTRRRSSAQEEAADRSDEAPAADAVAGALVAAGRVEDEFGHPIARARIRATIRVAGREEALESSSGSDGSFRVLAEHARGSLELRAEREGYATRTWSGLVAGTPAACQLRLLLARAASLRGALVLEEWIPRLAFRVRIEREGRALAILGPDEGGRFRAEALEPGPIEVRVLAPLRRRNARGDDDDRLVLHTSGAELRAGEELRLPVLDLRGRLEERRCELRLAATNQAVSARAFRWAGELGDEVLWTEGRSDGDGRASLILPRTASRGWIAVEDCAFAPWPAGPGEATLALSPLRTEVLRVEPPELAPAPGAPLALRYEGEDPAIHALVAEDAGSSLVSWEGEGLACRLPAPGPWSIVLLGGELRAPVHEGLTTARFER